MKKTLLSGLLILSGCAVGPDYHRPCVSLESEYEQIQGETEPVDLTHFWEQFEDPQMNEYVNQALCNNLDYLTALRKIEEFRAQYYIERSALYPQISNNMVVIRSRQSSTLQLEPEQDALTPAEFPGVFFPGITNFYQLGFDASWELDIWGKNRRRAEAGRYDFEATQEEALFIQVSLVSDVASSYIDIQTLYNKIDAKKEQVARQRELVHLNETRYAAGLISLVDVTLAEAELRAQLATLPPVEAEAQQLTHGLAVLLGRPPEGFSVEIGQIPKALGKIPDELPSTLLCRRPDIRKAERELAAATARIGVAKGELFPSFSLVGSFGMQSNLLDEWLTWPSRFWTIGPGMIWNLFTGGRLVNQVQVQNERQKQAILQYEQAIYSALQDVENRLVGYFKQRVTLQDLQKTLEERRLTRELYYSQYFAGLISFDLIAEAEQAYYKTKEALIEAEGFLMIELVGLYKALGGGWQCSDLQ